ncbi:LuxR C-terminal-related transcriptional regulator [Speluncibacter jeojiensis]|uniref:LuxR C-terminal-related transcriptional regulator n=1 Tax=Speluncibacter jeojiensis TaxID=2710754 RepID=A0A9X4M0E9_9ACTN|nr:LuxR C-terminal-related transcriptional regulator [Corynebacteriales bacterium D3-21]
MPGPHDLLPRYALAGMPAAADLYNRISAEPTRPSCRLIVGVAGSGKSMLLTLIREALRGADVPLADPFAESVPAGSAVIVDDAQDLSTERLAALEQLARRTDLTVLVAVRPRSSDARLSALGRAFADGQPHLVLARLSRTQATERARVRLGADALSPALVELIGRYSGGVVGTFDAALAALEDLTGTELRSRAQVEAALADAVRSRIIQTLRATPADVRAALVVAGLGVHLNAPELAHTLGVDEDAALVLIDRARCTGLLTDTDGLLSASAPALTAVVGESAIGTIQQRVLAARLELGTLSLATARALAAVPVRDQRLADHLTAAADAIAAADPAQAAELYEAALRTGTVDAATSIRHAESAGRSGNFDRALQIIDSTWEGSSAETIPTEDLRSAARISASVASCRGLTARSAELYGWLGPDRAGLDAPIGAVILLAEGRIEQAQAMLHARADRPQTSLSAAWSQLANALLQSLTSPAAQSLGAMMRAVSMMSTGRSDRMLPDTVTAIAATAALHAGELDRAESLLRRAVRDDDPIAGPRHALLLAWIAMLRGDLDAAQSQVDAVGPNLAQRDLLFAHGLRLGLARRRGDLGAVTQAWQQAQDAVAEARADLFNLLPLGELWVAAARLRAVPRILLLIDEARNLLSRLGEPPLWSAAVHWYGVQAAILSERPEDLVPHANSLSAAAESDPYAACLADAGRAWMKVLTDQADLAEVSAAATGLERVGLSWDGARLAGEAALHAGSTQDATALLQTARSLTLARTAGPSPDAPAKPALSGPLTDREGDVANLLVLGMPYREIGSRLFISAKTVEHHVARIRNRLGAQSRSEMLSMLRTMGYGAQPAAT